MQVVYLTHDLLEYLNIALSHTVDQTNSMELDFCSTYSSSDLIISGVEVFEGIKPMQLI